MIGTDVFVKRSIAVGRAIALYGVLETHFGPIDIYCAGGQMVFRIKKGVKEEQIRAAAYEADLEYCIMGVVE